ncbi:MAG: N-acetylneuraminate synthase [Candidatus Rifleibacteriota bacterium]
MFINSFSYKPIVIAEAGVNHNGDFKTACKLVEEAARAGADIIKFQTFKAYECASNTALTAEYQQKSNYKNQYKMLSELELPFSDFVKLKKQAEKLNLRFLSTPDGEESLNFLCKLKVEAIKIASGEITNLPFLKMIATRGLPVILSTGMSTIGEVERALNTLQQHGANEIMLLHCASSYPAQTEELNLKAMQTLKTAFNLPTGFSDHSIGNEASIVATALGAEIIEKHFTLDKTMPGPDHAASIEPQELQQLIESIRKAANMLGSTVKKPSKFEEKNIELVRRSICATKDLTSNQIITAADITCKRPANGIQPEFLTTITGRKCTKAIKSDQPIAWNHIGRKTNSDS